MNLKARGLPVFPFFWSKNVRDFLPPHDWDDLHLLGNVGGSSKFEVETLDILTFF